MGHPKSGIPEMGQPFWEILKWASPKQKFPKWASLVILNWASPFREFLIWAGPFWGFSIWCWPIQKNFWENVIFLACFPFLWVIFWLLTLIQSDDMDILQKESVQKLIPAQNRSSNILLSPICSCHCLLCSMTKLKEHSREIRLVVISIWSVPGSRNMLCRRQENKISNWKLIGPGQGGPGK